jgi:circadian clock protein KaiC
MKYRGSTHGTNEYPFLIEDSGISVLPISSISLDHDVSNERIETGIRGLDAMMGGLGFYRGSSVLISGTAGTGKSSIAAAFVAAACARGERCLYFAFEESPKQILRNMASIGIDLAHWVDEGLLIFHAGRPTQFGLETHLANMVRQIQQEQPAAVVIDPVSNLIAVGQMQDVKSMLSRLIDYLKGKQITAVFTHLTGGEEVIDTRDIGVSSLMDTWVSLRNLESGGERTRGVYILKSRGIEHSNQIREFVLADDGIHLLDVYVGPEGILTGTSRELQRMKDREIDICEQQENESKTRELDRKRELLEARISAMKAEFEAEEERVNRQLAQDKARDAIKVGDRAKLQRNRQGDTPISSGDAE